jgi:hypothetical protein
MAKHEIKEADNKGKSRDTAEPFDLEELEKLKDGLDQQAMEIT